MFVIKQIYKDFFANAIRYNLSMINESFFELIFINQKGCKELSKLIKKYINHMANTANRFDKMT